MARAHIEDVDIAHADLKAALHESVLENRAPDPYQYKLWIITHVLEGVRRLTGTSLKNVFFGNTVASLGFLLLAHHLWLKGVAPRGWALLGSVTLAALANVLFLSYHHHPYEFWGVGLFCFLLLGVLRDWDWRRLSALGLVTGLTWDKHVLLPVVWGILRLRKGDGVLVTAARGLVFLVACVAVPVRDGRRRGGQS